MCLNLSVNNEGGILGSPDYVADNFLSAVNISESTYRVGICTSTSPSDGTRIMEIPIQKSGQITLHMMVNNDLQSMDLNLTAPSGFDDVVFDGISVYPNPAKDQLFIELENELTRGNYIVIYDQLGQLVFRKYTDDLSLEIDLSGFHSNGLHFIQIIGKKGELVGTRKIVFEK